MSGEARGLDPIEEFEAYYLRYRLQVYRTIRGIVLDAAAAEDLTQETFERAFRWHVSRGSDVDSVGAWLHRIAVNAAISHLRRQKLARLLPVRLFTGAGPSGIERADDRSLVTKAMAALSPRLRAVVLLHFYAGMTRHQIARALGIPPGTVASRLGAALCSMRRALAEDEIAGAGRPGAPRTDQDDAERRLKSSAR